MLYTKLQTVTVCGLSAERKDFWSCRKQFLFHWYTHTTITITRTESREQNVSPFKALIKWIQRTEKGKKKTNHNCSPHAVPRSSFSIQCTKGKLISLDQKFSLHFLSHLKNHESQNNTQISLLWCLLLLVLPWSLKAKQKISAVSYQYSLHNNKAHVWRQVQVLEFESSHKQDTLSRPFWQTMW